MVLKTVQFWFGVEEVLDCSKVHTLHALPVMDVQAKGPVLVWVCYISMPLSAKVGRCSVRWVLSGAVELT